MMLDAKPVPVALAGPVAILQASAFGLVNSFIVLCMFYERSHWPHNLSPRMLGWAGLVVALCLLRGPAMYHRSKMTVLGRITCWLLMTWCIGFALVFSYLSSQSHMVA
jgi:hypothetical protein